MQANRPVSLLLRRSLYFVLILALVSGFGAVQPAAAAQSADNPSAQGVPYLGAPGIPETTGQIMARQALANLQPSAAARPAPRFGADLAGRQSNPDSAGLVQGPSAAAWISPFAVQAGPAQTLGLNFDGPTSADTDCASTNPPDAMGAVGPTQFIVALNCKIISYNKTTGAADTVLNSTPDTFFAPVRNLDATTDPHIRYDRTSGRWFITALTVTAPNRILVAVSNEATVTLTTVWTFFYILVDNSALTRTTCVANSPTLGIDANALYIGVNQDCTAPPGGYLTSDAYVVQKSSVTGLGGIKSTVFLNLVDVNLSSAAGPFDPQGVDNPNPAASEGYLIAADAASYGMLQLIRVKNPGGDPNDLVPANRPTKLGPYPFPIASTYLPYYQPHKGNNLPNTPLNQFGQLAASDGRLLGAYIRDGSLWTALVSSVDMNCIAHSTSADNNRDAVFWYEITGAPTGGAPAVHQSGSVCDLGTTTNPAFYSYGTIMVNGQGHAVIGYTKAGADNYTTPGFSGRLQSDALGVLEGTTDIAAGTHPYQPAFDLGTTGPRLWGNYSYTSLDPCDDMTLWTIQEYASADNQWGVRIAQIKSPPPATPTSTGPLPVPGGQASVNVVIYGTAAAGSGFYDTPATQSDACRLRLTAAVSGGVVVNSVTYNDPTHVTLNINTTGVTTLGPKDVTITNPDGQHITGTAVLYVGLGTYLPVVFK